MNIPRELLKEAVALSGAPSQTVAVIFGLEELIRRKKLEKLSHLMGSDAIKLSERDLCEMRSR